MVEKENCDWLIGFNYVNHSSMFFVIILSRKVRIYSRMATEVITMAFPPWFMLPQAYVYDVSVAVW